MAELKPSVLQMLLLGQDYGLLTVDDAYSNYMNHYDCFFLIDKFQEQHKDFVEELQSLGFVGGGRFKDVTIDEAIKSYWKQRILS